MANKVYIGTGRRKSSIAQVKMVPGKGKITVNGRDVRDFFPYETNVMDLMQPLVATSNENNFDITLEDLKLTWKSALKLAFELSNKNRIMYDLKESNAFILNGNFKVCDVDFYMKENLDNILNINYKLVNTTFIDFIERYLFSYCYKRNILTL